MTSITILSHLIDVFVTMGKFHYVLIYNALSDLVLVSICFTLLISVLNCANVPKFLCFLLYNW